MKIYTYGSHIDIGMYTELSQVCKQYICIFIHEISYKLIFLFYEYIFELNTL